MHMEDLLIQLFFAIVIIALIVGAILFLVSYRKRGRRLDRMESKLDKLLTNKEKRD